MVKKINSLYQQNGMYCRTEWTQNTNISHIKHYVSIISSWIQLIKKITFDIRGNIKKEKWVRKIIYYNGN